MVRDRGSDLWRMGRPRMEVGPGFNLGFEEVPHLPLEPLKEVSNNLSQCLLSAEQGFNIFFLLTTIEVLRYKGSA